MATVEFAPLAIKDLEDIIVYLAERNLTASQKIIKELMKKFQILAENRSHSR